MADYNTIGSETWREKYYKTTLAHVLRVALVIEKICEVDRTDNKVIKNPYGSPTTVVVSSLTGTYDVSNFTTTNDSLTVTDEFKIAEHIFDFQDVLSNFDLFKSRAMQQMFDLAEKMDSWGVNNLCNDGTGAYSTPSGGFTTASNITTILANLNSKVEGYKEAYNGRFLVIESSDTVGFDIALGALGAQTADDTLRNGWYRRVMGIDIYVVRDGTFVTSTVGTKTWTNDGHRVFGVKRVATYAAPRGVKYEEKPISGATGKEVVTYGYSGFKLWNQKTGLIVDITISA